MLTHDVLATMLAVRRPTVTLVMADLVHAGIVSTGRGVIRIVDRAGLEARSCACHRIVKALSDNLFAQDLPTPQTPQEEKQWPEPAAVAT
jgi:DNA-binding transcriptional regulator YhcF (GntR family)